MDQFAGVQILANGQGGGARRGSPLSMFPHVSLENSDLGGTLGVVMTASLWSEDPSSLFGSVDQFARVWILADG